MIGGVIRIGRVAGIPVGIHPLWLLIVALITLTLGAGYYPEEDPGIASGTAYALGLASALLLFASILAHEFGHAVVARRRGLRVEEIDLWLLGGVARISGTPARASDELQFALAGPAVTVLVALAFGAVLIAIPADTPDALLAVLRYQFTINVVILFFNLLPAFPLDGGRVARALLWWRWGDLTRATTQAAAIGRAFGYGFIALGFLGAIMGAPGGLWFALIGFFLIIAGRTEETQQRTKRALETHRVHELMAFPAVTIPAEISADEALRHYFVPCRYHAFPVVETGRATGIVTLDQVERLDPKSRQTTKVATITERDSSLFVDEDDELTEVIERPAFGRLGRAVVTPHDGGIGILSRTEVERALRAHRLLEQA